VGRCKAPRSSATNPECSFGRRTGAAVNVGAGFTGVAEEGDAGRPPEGGRVSGAGAVLDAAEAAEEGVALVVPEASLVGGAAAAPFAVSASLRRARSYSASPSAGRNLSLSSSSNSRLRPNPLTATAL
jgi:hypothetical protein